MPARRRAALYERLKVYLRRKGLRLNEAKTRVLDVRRERFQFLGFEISWRRSRNSGQHYPHVEPSCKSRRRLHESVRRELNHWTTWCSAVERLRRVNRIVRGWSSYFHCGNCVGAFSSQQDWLRERLRGWLWQKYGRQYGRYSFFTNARLHGQYGLEHMPLYASWTREPSDERYRKAGCGKSARPV